MDVAKSYQLFEHTADIGVKIKGGSLPDLFNHAAAAMFDIAAEKINKKHSKIHKLSVKQKADNLEELFVNWLNELLSLSAAKGLIFTSFNIKELNHTHIAAMVSGYSAKDYRFNAEIKAATYHRLSVKQLKSGWQAKVIFDV